MFTAYARQSFAFRSYEEPKQARFLAMNLMGKIPILELYDGAIISGSTAITEYLDNLDSNPILTGKTPKEKDVIHMMQRRAEMMVIDPIDDYFHYGTPRLGLALRPWRMPEWGGAQEWGKRRGFYAVANLAYFDSLLSNQPYLAGGRFSMADITLYCSFLFADLIGLPLMTGHSSLIAWRKRVDALPSVSNRSRKGTRA
ncbi:glutathione S-transferase C-terminal domain-containing protein [Sphingobium sp. CR2-8]|uniref:glutathione S-transferase C-terminal domain-containing protein n=1 Tax=Sphingobium sp. CR2-8 TaxID=1306534 RepID=UPI002DB70900|nr:glutathione S-transferase C-terminal domain-containing protein [Sphingobium sp. CR2-8]MEC3909552.1 glutathione S-transferase C-terminal domain-containing protein [Sphingobium sp. CR2-8]